MTQADGMVGGGLSSLCSGWIFRIVFAFTLLLGHIACADEQSQTLRYGFESDPPIAVVASRFASKTARSHGIIGDDFHAGLKCERFTFQSEEVSTDSERVVITLPRARVFSELSSSLWVRSNCANVRLGLRVRFPHSRDPQTNDPLMMELTGDVYTEVGKWQQLFCRTTDESIRGRILRFRNQLADGIQAVRLDAREAYVDQLVLTFQIPQGSSVLQIDDLEFGPVVEPATSVPEDQVTRGQITPRLTIADGRIRRDGEPFYPLFTLYHGESLELLSQTGVNMVWIRDYQDRSLLKALEQMQIGGIATPPQPTPEAAILGSSGIPPIPEWTTPIWAWMLGIRIPASDRKYLSGWAEQVRDADRFVRRPVLADVAGEEREFHRNIDFLASSRFAIHTSVSSPDHFKELRARRDVALPGKPMFTFVQTEPSAPLLDYFERRDVVPVLEPEQILHQGYEAIAAGFKGVGFWKQIPFDTSESHLDERLDALKIFCIHSRLLEPYLATGKIVDEIEVQVGKPMAGPTSSNPLSSRWDRTVNAAGAVVKGDGASGEIQASVFQTERGLLIFLVWHEPGSQCVPGPQTASLVRVLVRGIDIANAWEVAPTGIFQSNLQLERVPGGTEIMLKEFDQVAVIVIPTDPQEKSRLDTQARQTRKMAAEAYLNLALAKRQRVLDVQAQLDQVGAPKIPGIDAALSRSLTFTEEARRDLQTERIDQSCIASRKAMQQLRMVQRAHWEAAVDPLGAPTSTLEATSFQTLPEHWRLMSALGKIQHMGTNLLPSGEFEDENALFQGVNKDPSDSWSDGSTNPKWTSLRLERGVSQTGTCLTMLVKPDSPPGQSAVLASPKINVKSGDLVVITGQVRVPYRLDGPGQHFAVFDTLTGRDGAVVLTEASDEWKSFRIVRRIQQPGALRLRFELIGPGVAQLDHLNVHLVPGTAP